jgi:hypothetical protein
MIPPIRSRTEPLHSKAEGFHAMSEQKPAHFWLGQAPACQICGAPVGGFVQWYHPLDGFPGPQNPSTGELRRRDEALSPHAAG